MEKEGSRRAGVSQRKHSQTCSHWFVTGVESERDLELAQPGASGPDIGFCF